MLASLFAGCSSSGSAPATGGATFCQLLAVFEESNASIDSAFEAEDSAVTDAALAQMSTQLEQMSGRAPGDVGGDVQRMLEFMASLRALLGRYDFDVEALQADPAGMTSFSELDLDGYSASRDALLAYNVETCAAQEEPTVATA